MSDELMFDFRFSIVDFKINNDNNIHYWFDLKDTSVIHLDTKIVPLFNTALNKHHDVWDDFLLADIKIIINLVKSTNSGNKLLKEELISYEALLEQFDHEKHVYNLKLDFNIDALKEKITSESYYTINLSFLIEDILKEGQNVFDVIDKNTFFSTVVPFSAEGGWLHGQR